MQLAGRVHGCLVAEPEYHGEIENGPTIPLKVYCMEKLPGITYVDMMLLSSKGPSFATKHVNTVLNFARYIPDRLPIPLLHVLKSS